MSFPISAAMMRARSLIPGIVQTTSRKNGGQQLDGGAKGLNALVHFAIDLGNGDADGIDLLKVQPQQKAVSAS